MLLCVFQFWKIDGESIHIVPQQRIYISNSSPECDTTISEPWRWLWTTVYTNAGGENTLVSARRDRGREKKAFRRHYIWINENKMNVIECDFWANGCVSASIKRNFPIYMCVFGVASHVERFVNAFSVCTHAHLNKMACRKSNKTRLAKHRGSHRIHHAFIEINSILSLFCVSAFAFFLHVAVSSHVWPDGKFDSVVN